MPLLNTVQDLLPTNFEVRANNAEINYKTKHLPEIWFVQILKTADQSKNENNVTRNKTSKQSKQFTFI